MFCNQCEQTVKGVGCEKVAPCGKNGEVADLQDLLVHAVQGLALFAAEGRKRGIVDEAADLFTLEAIFATLTNVDFDPARFQVLISRAVELREGMKSQVAKAGGRVDFAESPNPAATAILVLPNGKAAVVAMQNPVLLKHRSAERVAHHGGVASHSFREQSTTAAVTVPFVDFGHTKKPGRQPGLSVESYFPSRGWKCLVLSLAAFGLSGVATGAFCRIPVFSSRWE